MSWPDPFKVSIRIDIVVEGGEVKSVATTAPTGADLVESRRAGGGEVKSVSPRRGAPLSDTDQELDIIIPFASTMSSGSDFPVFVISGQNCIGANGTCPLPVGSFPGRVFAMAYPNVTINPNDPAYATPPPEAATDTPLSAGTWCFSQTKGNPVPGATCDGIVGGANNSTLIVWYQPGDSPDYMRDSTRFHGYAPGGSCVQTSEIGRVARLPAAAGGASTLYATFSGALASLGSITLQRNGASWYAVLPCAGGSVMSFSPLGADYALILAGPGPTFGATGKLLSDAPFLWAGTGATTEPFQVTVTE